MKLPLRRNLDDVSKICGLETDTIIHFIQEEWVSPIDIELKMLDEEDICRILLIHDLQEKFGVNDEAIPIILHLVDQLNYIIHNSERDTL
mgnify:CR=1 FL=1